MSAYEMAKQMEASEVIAKVASAGIKEYGVYAEPLADKWNAIIANKPADLIVAAGINNSDSKKVLLGLVNIKCAQILEGIAITAQVLGATDMRLLLPEDETELAASLKEAADSYGITIENTFISANAYREHGLFHIETMLAVAEAIEGTYEPGAYVSVAGGELKKVAYGTKLADIVDIDDAKAVEIGSHLYTAAAAAEMVIDADTILGDGSINVLGNDKCLMQEAEKRLLAARKTSCGKCTFCREGLNQIYGHITDITSGKGAKEGMPMMKEIGDAMTFSCNCSVGTVGADFVLDALEHFTSEFDAHIKKRTCPAGVCTCFTTIYIDPNLCEGCEECADVCPVDCIEGKAGHIHMIDDFDCTKCGKCIEACEYEAVIQTTGRVPKLPTRLTKCGKFKKR
ncbi:MAG: 4Fe-4S binding protein [Eubacterium sp.]|nr:4Fe-4S binding protein [Eubacterium sp.]